MTTKNMIPESQKTINSVFQITQLNMIGQKPTQHNNLTDTMKNIESFLDDRERDVKEGWIKSYRVERITLEGNGDAIIDFKYESKYPVNKINFDTKIIDHVV